ncbi:uncharacterized protein [Apostichopus japonicus]|uniref:uncharacterized protein isoform X2 n=1 Tax=Stichopus japonicus TaxID=307972 RepID=UPI003AB16321
MARLYHHSIDLKDLFLCLLFLCGVLYLTILERPTLLPLNHEGSFLHGGKINRQEKHAKLNSITRMISASELTVVADTVADHQVETTSTGGLLMANCPNGWSLEVIKKGDADNPPSQVCRNDNSNAWVCGPGFDKLAGHPYCKKGSSKSILQYPIAPKYSQISEEHQLLFIHIPLAGGDVIETSYLFDDQRRVTGGHPLGGYHKIDEFDAIAFQDFYKFAVVRHPCSRLHSVWKVLSQEWIDHKTDNNLAGFFFDDVTSSSFEAFMERSLFPGGDVHIESNEHLQTQVGMLFRSSGKFDMDQLLVFESWNQSILDLGSRINMDTSSLQSEMIQLDCSKHYNPASWAKLTNLYAIDFCVLGYSMNLHDSSELQNPELDLTPDTLASRYQECTTRRQRDDITHKMRADRKGYHSDDITSSNNTNCVIYTYFQKINAIAEEERIIQAAILQIWTESWTLAGWNPRILSEEDAKTHPDYLSLRAKFEQLPTINRKEYEMSCFLRYVAMATVGGGWMSDFDVLPFQFPACSPPFKDSFTIYEGIVPALVYGTSNDYTRVARLMGEVEWQSNPTFIAVGKPHVSDMLCFAQFLSDGLVDIFSLVEQVETVFQVPFSCNSTSKEFQMRRPDPSQLPIAVHYSHRSISVILKAGVLTSLPLGLNQTQVMSITRAQIMSLLNKFLHDTCLSNQ